MGLYFIKYVGNYPFSSPSTPSPSISACFGFGVGPSLFQTSLRKQKQNNKGNNPKTRSMPVATFTPQSLCIGVDLVRVLSSNSGSSSGARSAHGLPAENSRSVWTEVCGGCGGWWGPYRFCPGRESTSATARARSNASFRRRVVPPARKTFFHRRLVVVVARRHRRRRRRRRHRQQRGFPRLADGDAHA